MSEAPIILRHPEHLSAPCIKLLEGLMTLGRDPSCQIVLADPSVSRFHAELLVNGTSITVRDLKSRNGTYVQGERIESADVRPGQRVQFGCVQLRVDNEDDVENTKSISDVFEAFSTDPDAVPLSVAERRVFDQILIGHSEKEIAHLLGLSPNTVHCHIRKIYQVLGVRSRGELMARFVRRPSGTATKDDPESGANRHTEHN